jgi:hypothetical protein
MSDTTNNDKPVGVLQTTDADGRIVNSSKRWMGTALIIAGGLLLAAVGVAAIFREIADQAAALSAGQSLVITGAALLGVGVLDGLGQNIGKAIGGGR